MHKTYWKVHLNSEEVFLRDIAAVLSPVMKVKYVWITSSDIVLPGHSKQSDEVFRGFQQVFRVSLVIYV